MCNLTTIKATGAEIAGYYQATEDWRRSVVVEKDYVAPGKPGWLVREHEGERVLDAALCGFPLPNGKPVTNVRNYTSPFWKSALKNPARRCLVPVTEFEEWSVEPDPKTGKKRRYRFHMPSQSIFTFAGIWRPTGAEPVYSFLTCGYSDDPETELEAAAAHVVGAIHPKAIPVILHQEDYDRWLHADIDDALELACAFPSQLIAVKG
jgi:putative SOS response-associated peptidase YedK